MKEISLNGHTFKVNVIIKKRNKRIYMRVKQGYIEFTTPVNLTDARIKEIISNNMNLVLKNINPKEKSDEYIHYLGQKYNLILKESTSNFVYISDNNFIVEYTNEK
jgi:predicted metal-dependent hydrolase